MTARASRLGMLIASLLASLLAAEGVLRLATGPGYPRGAPFGPGIGVVMVYDPVFGWRNVPTHGERFVELDGRRMPVDYQVNDLGFRGGPVAVEKPAGTIRIVCLGDSATFGVVAAPDPVLRRPRWTTVTSYPEYLARRLENEKLAPVEVINAGVIGYSSAHVLRQLVLRVRRLDPDVVTLRVGANDANFAFDPARRALEPENPIVRALLYRFHDWRLVRLALAAHQGTAVLHPEPETVRWTTTDRFEDNIERIIQLSRADGFRLALLDYPLGDAPRGAWSDTHRRLHDLLQQIAQGIARSHGIPIVETERRLVPERSAFFNAVDAVHPNQRGMRRIADALFEDLLALGWLEPSR